MNAAEKLQASAVLKQLIAKVEKTIQRLYPKDWQDKMNSAASLIERTMYDHNLNTADAIRHIIRAQKGEVGFVALKAAEIFLKQ